MRISREEEQSGLSLSVWLSCAPIAATPVAHMYQLRALTTHTRLQWMPHYLLAVREPTQSSSCAGVLAVGVRSGLWFVCLLFVC